MNYSGNNQSNLTATACGQNHTPESYGASTTTLAFHHILSSQRIVMK